MWLNVQGSSAGALGIAGCSGRLETDQSFEKTSRGFFRLQRLSLKTESQKYVALKWTLSKGVDNVFRHLNTSLGCLVFAVVEGTDCWAQGLGARVWIEGFRVSKP